MTAFWIILAVVGGVLLGGFIVFYVLAYLFSRTLGQVFGLMVAPWWKFW